MADEPTWGIIGGGAGATIIAAAFGLWDRFFRQRKEGLNSARAERDAVLANLGVREAAYMDRIEKDLARRDIELAREQARVEQLEISNDRGWDIARGWKMRCHDLRHDLGNARSTADSLLIAQGKPKRIWPDETLPALEDIVADNVERAARKLVDFDTAAAKP